MRGPTNKRAHKDITTCIMPIALLGDVYLESGPFPLSGDVCLTYLFLDPRCQHVEGGKVTAEKSGGKQLRY